MLIQKVLSNYFHSLALDCFKLEFYLSAILAFERAIQYEPANANIVDMDNISHRSVVCDGCSNAIKGIRFKCKACEDYDLCVHCFENRSTIHPSHESFLQIPRSSWTLSSVEYHN